MLSQVTFKFEIGRYNGSMGMHMCYNGQQLLEQTEFETDTFEFTTQLDLPGTLTIDVYGKQPDDTLVDAAGNIVADKYIKLNDVIIDKVSLHVLSLIKLAELTTETEVLNTNYWGFNGQVSIQFQHRDSFLWHLEELKKMSA